nr:TPA_asm: hypothetical protein HUJ06_026906 [Nelumbo nucifera]
MKIHHVLVGCTQTTQGQKFSNVVDGILGLGYSPNSFATKVLQVFGSKFSYCLVDHLSPRNVSNYLVFGRNHIVNVNPPEMQYTELMVGKVLPYYAVNVIGISIGGVLLRIPLSVWNLDKNGGTILDSGTSLTLLVEPAYRLVIDALKVALIMYKKAEVPEFEVCIKVDKAFDEGLVPRLGIHFAGGARLLPPVKSYLIDVADGIKCLGFRSVFWPGISVIGNIMQQNFFWELDLRRERVGFAPSSCA